MFVVLILERVSFKPRHLSFRMGGPGVLSLTLGILLLLSVKPRVTDVRTVVHGFKDPVLA